MTKKIISIVISAYNEEGNINELYKQLLQNTKEKDCRYKYEFVFVNDGSTDKTLGKIKALQHHDSDVRIVNLKRNFRHEIAMTAGMDHALGDAVIFYGCRFAASSGLYSANGGAVDSRSGNCFKPPD